MCIFTNRCSIKSIKIMRKILIILLMFGIFSKVSAVNNKTAYDYKFKSLDGDLIKLSEYKGKIIVVVNVASR